MVPSRNPSCGESSFEELVDRRPRRVNPNYAIIKMEADALITSLQAFTPGPRARSIAVISVGTLLQSPWGVSYCPIDLLACLAYSKASEAASNLDPDVISTLG